MKGKKGGKDPKSTKQGTQLKDVIPPTIKQLPRDGKPVKAPEPGEKKILINEYFSQPVPEEWPGDEVAAAHDFGVDNPNAPVFNDQTKLVFPPSFSTDSTMMVFPRRIKDILKTESKVHASNFEDNGDSKSLSVRSALRRSTTTSIGGGIKPRSASTFWEEDHELSGSEKTDFTINIFTIYEREETKEEMEKRIKEASEVKQDPKKKKTTKGKVEEPVDVGPRMVKDVKLSNVDFNNKLPEYSRWIASQLQIIKDRNIRDAYVSNK